MAVVGLYPLVAMPLARGAQWNGLFPYLEADEHAYAAYANAIAQGRPRRNDPYTGRDDSAQGPQPESFLSVQFVPAYATAAAARLSGVNVSTVFALITLGACVALALVVFRLALAVTGDARVAALCAVAVVCLGTVPTMYGPARSLLGRGPLLFLYPVFLRRYIPALALPLYFGFLALAWRARPTAPKGRASALAAGLAFALLVFTYFYLWTAAAAWFAAFALLRLSAARAPERRAHLRLFAVTAAVAALALVPYFLLLARRDPVIDATHWLVRARAPDLFRGPEVLALVVLAALAAGAWRRMVSPRDRAVVFVAACALTPFAVFNQQLVTNRSLQPIHYEAYVANLTALLAALLAAALLARGKLEAKTYGRLLLLCAAASFVWGLAGSALSSRGERERSFAAQDAALPAALRLAELGRAGGTLDTRSIVFAPDTAVADFLPTVAPQPVLWAPHSFVFTGIGQDEDGGERERFAQFLHYSGVSLDDYDGHGRGRFDAESYNYLLVLRGRASGTSETGGGLRPLDAVEARELLRGYAGYRASFDRTRAARTPVSYLLVAADSAADLSGFDRWYERDAGERHGGFLLHRVRLRP